MKKFITILSAILVIGITNAQTSVTVNTYTPSFLTFTNAAQGGGFCPVAQVKPDSIQYETDENTPKPVLTNSANPFVLTGIYDSVYVKLKIKFLSGYFDGDVKVVVNGDTTTFLNNSTYNSTNDSITFIYSKKVANTSSSIKIDLVHKTTPMSGFGKLKVKYSNLRILVYSTTFTTGIADNKLNNITTLSAYPNPNNGSFTVQFDTKEKITPVYVHDISGRLVLTENSEREIGANKVSFDNALTTGMYIVKAGDKSFKIIVR